MIFFDIDGTLLDDASAVAAGLDAFHARYHGTLRVTRAALGSTWQRLADEHFSRYLRGEISMQEQRRERVRAVLGANSREGRTDALDVAFATYLTAYEQAWTVFPDVLRALPLLAAYPLGVITNGNHEQQVRKLEQTDIAKFFQVIVTSEGCGAAKPDRRIFLEACDRVRVALAAAFYVGDSWSVDVLGSRAAGLRSIWVYRDGASGPTPAADALVIESFEQLPAVIERNSHPAA